MPSVRLRRWALGSRCSSVGHAFATPHPEQWVCPNGVQRQVDLLRRSAFLGQRVSTRRPRLNWSCLGGMFAPGGISGRIQGAPPPRCPPRLPWNRSPRGREAWVGRAVCAASMIRKDLMLQASLRKEGAMAFCLMKRLSQLLESDRHGTSLRRRGTRFRL